MKCYLIRQRQCQLLITCQCAELGSGGFVLFCSGVRSWGQWALAQKGKQKRVCVCV